MQTKSKKEKVRKKRAKLVLLESDGETLNLILFWSHLWKKFIDIGGRVDSYECFETALVREVLEETANLIDITNIVHSSKYIDVNTKDEDIRVYFIIIDSSVFCEEMYIANRKAIGSFKDVPECWKETGHCSKFSIINVLGCFDQRNDAELLHCNDVTGKSKIIYPEIRRYIVEAYSQNIIIGLLQENQIAVKYFVVRNISDTFKHGTFTIRLLKI